AADYAGQAVVARAPWSAKVAGEGGALPSLTPWARPRRDVLRRHIVDRDDQTIRGLAAVTVVGRDGDAVDAVVGVGVRRRLSGDEGGAVAEVPGVTQRVAIDVGAGRRDGERLALVHGPVG